MMVIYYEKNSDLGNKHQSLSQSNRIILEGDRYK